MIVVDATALVDLLIDEPRAAEAIAELAGDDPLHVPEVAEPELLNSLRRLVRHGTILPEKGEAALEALAALPLVRHPHEPLRARVWELRHNLSAYDASYLALAETLEGATLVTGDAGLAEQARKSLGTERVRHIA